MHILISPNAFKNSLSASDAAMAIQDGFLKSNLDCTCECFPIGDGGDGTADLIIKKFNGVTVNAEVNDPLGRKVKASFGLIAEGKTAVIEMARASGLKLLQQHELNPLQASSFGTGQLIKLALMKSVTQIILCMGGSATVDGGVGILKALGVCFLDRAGNELSGMPETLVNLASIDISSMDQRIRNCEIVVLCDVSNLLLGKEGAAPVFGPQKGSSPNDVRKLKACLERFNAVVFQQTGKDMSVIKYGGTAGGAAAGLYAITDAKLVNGIDHFLKLTEFEKALSGTDLVITGEGSIDEQTLQGKGPFGVAQRAKRNDIPVIGLAGKVPVEKQSNLLKYFDVLLSIGHEPADLTTAMQFTSANLTRTSREIGDLLALAGHRAIKVI